MTVGVSTAACGQPLYGPSEMQTKHSVCGITQITCIYSISHHPLNSLMITQTFDFAKSFYFFQLTFHIHRIILGYLSKNPQMILNINRTLRMPEKTHTPTSHHHHHITHSLFNQVNPYYHELSKRLSDLFSCHHMSQKYFLSLMEFPVYIIYTTHIPSRKVQTKKLIHDF